ncbi:HEAT repeat domain-containing protein [Actinomadura xylanilytica]|uniref:HEAT repeat domain-containing protein n=1 Tax=Actinomadura xylanilytica TaxID=887459 RepID=UPI00255AFB63|nr:HEAT repeat domain-containing protein [Actinomadura xylanilytica]MDL4772735.1 HEAT repeat domain-containing protein [Actinomadura xylanilytica]
MTDMRDAVPSGLDPLTCAPGVLRGLVRQPDPAVRRAGLVGLAERLGAERDEDRAELPGFAECLPGFVDASPEAALALARLHLRLRAHVREPPRWRAAEGLPARVRVAWLSAEIAGRPATVRDEPAGEALCQAVHGLGAADVDDPEALARELADRPEPALHAEALRITREAVHAALLASSRARALVLRIATDSPGTGAGVAALRELAEPWAALDPLPEGPLNRFLNTTGDAAAADAAVEVAARQGHQRLLRDVAAGAGRAPALRRRALELLGDLAGRDDIGDLIAIAAGDPLLLAGPAARCLRRLHRRGHFPVDGDVPAIVRLALADHTVRPDEVATVLFTCRRAALAELTAAAVGDPSWPRRLDLLVALAAQGAADLPAGDAVTGLLRTAADPAPFLRAIRALRHTAAEEQVIEALPRSPAAALDALEAVGGARTVAALREGLGLDGPSGVVPHLRPFRHRALELVWHLTGDADARRSLLVRLHPRALPRRIAADLGGPDEAELSLLRAALDPADPAAALRTLARHGGPGTVPAIADLLLRVVSDLAAASAPSAPSRPGGESAEPAVPDEVVSAVRDLGGRLHERGKIRPRCLLDAAGAREAGDALVADLVLDLLDRPGLTAAETAILLGVLSRTASRGVRARVHPLLRHRDRHVRKHVIALLARDTDGADAQALSASLVPLTAAPDAQTARQALLALGHARARWAAAAVAACLDHPNMNVKKTAAAALARAGGPVAVPRLLFWLGAHDNPGLRAALVEALRAILGDAYAATIVAAAERAADDRARTLLLRGLDGVVSARAVGALADQGSPAGTALLALVPDGWVRLGSGTVTDLADRFAAHGIVPPPAAAPEPDADLALLAARGWNADAAWRLAERFGTSGTSGTSDELAGLDRLRGSLARWLELADARPAGRDPLLRFTLRLCPAPWSDGELETFARSGRLLAAALPGVGAPLLPLLEKVAPLLPASEALETAERVRALPPGIAGGRSSLALLRRCRAVLTRADLDRALAAARASAEPVRDVLHEAFEATDSAPPGEEARAWRTSLEAAARGLADLARFRAADDAPSAPGSRDRLNALIDVFPAAAQDVGAALLDWMTDLQPVDAPPWTLTENARPAPRPRAPRPGDLDQPRSTAQRERLLAMLDDPVQGRRDAAAQALLGWPEPEIRHALLRAYLHGRVDLSVTAPLASALTGLDDAADPERFAAVTAHLAPPCLTPFIPGLLRWWEHGTPGTRAAARQVLRRAAPDLVAEALSERVEAGAWGLLDLVANVSLLRTPALTRTRRRLRAEGRGDLADRIHLVDGPLRHPDAGRRDSAALTALRTRVHAPQARTPSRAELLRLARTGGTEQIRRALSLLAEPFTDAPAPGRPPARDFELEELLAESLGHPEARVRLHAHRLSRKVLARPAYLEQTARLLDDRQPDIARAAIRTLAHAGWAPAIPALVGLLAHPRPTVRRTAADGLARIGAPAVPALTHAAGRARPDRRRVYTAVLEKIT